MDAYWGYNQASSTNNQDIASPSPPTGDAAINTTYWQYWGNSNGNYTDDSDEYGVNSYFGSVYGDVSTYLERILDVLTLTAIVATAATLLVVIVNRRLHKQHLIFSANIIVSGLVTACSIGLRIAIDFHGQECRTFCELLVYTPCFAALVTNISILSVAVYQLINIRIDPFRSRGIVTTARCVAVVLLTWSIVGALGIIAILFSPTDVFLLILTRGNSP
ncbi:uncharacterized protein LOC121420626 [Lytechinus variegatus]|uniref:uncharacterized protein LOC121420626 n=1 Tax=Lytechinus variegatus TaxID=7654 RepID=UPI001BB1E879|nr:uncharacterized protein LOC121420626 [Lytechinus variegatus]